MNTNMNPIEKAISDFQSQIKGLRKKKNITQSELAEKTGISRSSISNIEIGKHNLTHEIMFKIINILDPTMEFMKYNPLESKIEVYNFEFTTNQMEGKIIFTQEQLKIHDF